jgi:hypothetical protein
MPYWLEASAEISPINMTSRQELIDGAVDGHSGNCEHAATRSEDCHAVYTALHVDDGAAFSGRTEGQIQADETVDGTAAATMPSRSRDGDDAEAGDRRTFMTSDRHDDVTRAQRRGIGGLRCR